LTRFIEKLQSFQKCYNSKYRQHLLETGHPLWTIDNTMKILHTNTKGLATERLTLNMETKKYNRLNANVVSSLMLYLALYRRTKKKKTDHN